MTAGAVLCGGASRRMGADKALIEVDGTPMAERVARSLAAAGCDPVFLVGGDPAALDHVGRTTIADRWPGQGPLGGIVTALSATVDDTIVAACDLAQLDADTVRSLLTAAAGAPTGTEVVVARTGRLEPALAWWSRSASAPLQALWSDGVRAVHEAIAAVRSMEVVVDAAALRNVNRPNDLPGRRSVG
ncbi:MAG: molybdenum cofactor guanylyltransferase [Ilumatobacteraceae bacterium]